MQYQITYWCFVKNLVIYFILFVVTMISKQSNRNKDDKSIYSMRMIVLLAILLMPSVMYAGGRYSSAGEAIFIGCMQGLLIFIVYAIYQHFKNKNKNKDK